MKKIILLSLVCLLMMSCRQSKQLLTQIPIQTKIEVRDRIVSVPAPQDSSMIRALFACDSNNQVILKNYQELKSAGLSTSFNQIPGGIEIKVNTNRDSLKAKVHDSLVYKEVPIIHEVPKYIDKPMSWLNKTLCIVGGISLLILLLFIVSKFYNPFKK